MSQFDIIDLLVAPRRAIRMLIDERPRGYVWAFVCLGGISDCLARASSQHSGEKVSSTFIFVLAFVLGPFFGVCTVWVLGFLLDVTQSWFRGVARPEDLRQAIAWSFFPAAVRLLFFIPEWLYYGDTLFTSVERDKGFTVLGVTLAVFEVFFGLWRTIALSKMIAEVEGYRSAWKGWLHFIIACVCIILPMVLLVLAITLIR